jgi:adenosylcobinamide-GDP ribazoletransferase
LSDDGERAGPLAGLAAAGQFLTRIPIRTRAAPDLASAVVWFPVVGALIGAAVGAVAAGLFEWVAAPVAAAVAVIIGVLVTGAFHEDGLADTADGFGGWTPEQRREILKDSRHGTYGVAAITGSIVVRVAAVASLGPAAAFAGLVAAHALGRGVAVGAMGWATPVATPGLGADYARSVTRARSSVAAATALAIAALATGWWALPLALASLAVGAIVVAVTRRAFGGFSGDILGAIEQVVECVVLVIVSGLAARHTLWWA